MKPNKIHSAVITIGVEYKRMTIRLLLISLFMVLLATSCDNGGITPEPEPEPDVPYVPSPQVPGRVAIAYVTYYGSKIPETDVITHINYAFAELYVREGNYQGFKLQGKQSRFESVIAVKKQKPDIKICISFTHTVSNSDNSQGGGFSAMASTDEGRKAFAQDCKEFLEKWGLDGVDIDWELPGISWSGHACDPLIDTDNYTLLMKQLRETLGDKYLITLAGYIMNKRPVSSGGWRYVDLKAVAPYVDFMNIMTYDMDEKPHHHSALQDSRAYWDCQRAVTEYLNAGVPASKLVLGIPFYGRCSFSKSPTAISYAKILNLDKTAYTIDNWDATASVPFVTYNGGFYCGYDNARSIGVKADWALKRGLLGLMYWDYDQDDNKGTLRHAVWEGVMKL